MKTATEIEAELSNLRQSRPQGPLDWPSVKTMNRIRADAFILALEWVAGKSAEAPGTFVIPDRRGPDRATTYSSTTAEKATRSKRA